MPTPVSAARQCLTPEAATALDEAVAVAKRRGHAQTTSLHAVSALLSLPSSAIHDACARSRNAAYSPRLQFKALELCLSVSLDRVPSGQLADDPPVSNSLMAAIKRSQANQRRQPENFHLYHQMSVQCSSSSSTSPSSINNMIKVELQHLILSILDDPVVSRVFGEAGFRSNEIKLAIARPLPHLFRYGRPRDGLPPFLQDGPEFGRRGLGFNFPFSVFPGFSDVDENCRRIGELLVRSKGRNPLLVGVCAIDALQSFVESVKSKKEGCLPRELSGLSSVFVEDDLSNLVAEEKVEETRLDSVFGEVSDAARRCSGAGLLVNFGDLKGFVSDRANSDVVTLMVARLARLLEAYSGKVWLIGAATSYDTCLKFLSRFPSAEKELDLQILPITTLRPPTAESVPCSSLTESFVPFAGLFSTSSELSIPVSGSSYQCVSPRDVHSEKRKQETFPVTRGGTAASVADQYQCSLPSWLRMTEHETEGVAAKQNDGNGLSATACAPRTESQHTSQHSYQPVKDSSSSHVAPRFRIVTGFKSATESRWSEHDRTLSKTDSCLYGCNSSTDDGRRTSPASSTSVPTRICLGTAYASEAAELNVQGNLLQSSCRQSPDIDTMDLKMLYGDLIKKLGRQAEAVRSICEALCRARSGSHRKAASRGDLWFTFLGGDKIGKRRVAVALSDILRKPLICVDLCPKGGGIRRDDVIFGKRIKSYDAQYRGKTTVDVVAEELGKHPCSLIFLENVEKADEQVQSNLSQAFWSGKFSDSYGREVSMRNAVVIAASNLVSVGGVLSEMEEFGRYSEDRVLGSKCWQMKILVVERAIADEVIDDHGPVPPMSKTPTNKRKLDVSKENVVLLKTSESVKRANKNLSRGLDLNLPAEGEEALRCDDEDGSPDDSDTISVDTIQWLSEFVDRMDGKASFKPYDLDSLADDIFKGMKDSFRKHVGSGCSLEIDSKVVDQLVLTAYVCDGENTWEEWLKQVLNRELTELRDRFRLSERSVVRLIASGDPLSEDQAFGGHLPSRIVIESCPLE